MEAYKRIAMERAARGWSQQELAKRSGFYQKRISRIERGEYEMKLSEYEKLCSILGIDSTIPKEETPNDPIECNPDQSSSS